MNGKAQIVILSFSDIQRDGRVLRQIQYLSPHFDVSVIGYGELPAQLSDRVSMYSIQAPPSRARRLRKAFWLPLAKFASPRAYETWYWMEGEFSTAYDFLCDLRPLAIHANDWESLPVAVRAAGLIGARVVSDLHEYAPLMRENRRYWRAFYKPAVEYFLHKYLSATAASITVSEVIADRYRTEYAINPIVIMNAPKLPSEISFRATDPDNIRLVHHGHAQRDRQLELMIETVALLPDPYTLHFMLVDRSPGYIEELRALAERCVPGRVYFHPPVSPTQIVERISEFDVGIFPLPSINYNYAQALPNKLFEFIAAGLAVCVGPSPGMAHLVCREKLGIVASDLLPATMARLLAAHTAADIDQMKRNAIQARKILNADVELQKLINLYEDLLS